MGNDDGSVTRTEPLEVERGKAQIGKGWSRLGIQTAFILAKQSGALFFRAF